ncbi:3-hydroxylacyl-ACP dehydratase [Herminiimonas sp. KBW02]|uniref:ApeP family dehydratase n=1 Tax=Herminiimonas sp. KBW02 TaxID=2153363 RepID=UPI000F596B75|nr:hotdog family protein [Herminiimonas sp. KBW02]RQO37113.1 3-hydroxylacyl-ACP dehydratase [Herminiimonas sp. KBW02]
MTLPDIRSLVPHSGPMVLLDRVIAVGEESLCAEVSIRPDTLFCDGAGVGAWVGVEYMAQAVAAFAGYEAHLRGEAVKVGFLLGSRRYAAKCASFATGSKLHVHVQRALQGENGLGAFECRIDVVGDPGMAAVATASITVFQPENVGEFLQKISE